MEPTNIQVISEGEFRIPLGYSARNPYLIGAEKSRSMPENKGMWIAENVSYNTIDEFYNDSKTLDTTVSTLLDLKKSAPNDEEFRKMSEMILKVTFADYIENTIIGDKVQREIQGSVGYYETLSNIVEGMKKQFDLYQCEVVIFDYDADYRTVANERVVKIRSRHAGKDPFPKDFLANTKIDSPLFCTAAYAIDGDYPLICLDTKKEPHYKMAKGMGILQWGTFIVKEGLKRVGYIHATKREDNVPFNSRTVRTIDYIAQRAAPSILSSIRHEELKAIAKENEAIAKEKEALSLTDSLTNVPNQRYLEIILEEEIRRQGRTGKPFSMAIIDIDHFKEFNDTYGHSVGDSVLISMAGHFHKYKREADFFARAREGDEFALIFPETALKEAVDAIKRIYALYKKTGSRMAGIKKGVTLSIGMDTISPGEHSKRSVFDLIDKLLYQAKNEGRDRIVHPKGTLKV